MTETCKKADRKVKVARFEEPSPKRVSFQETPGPSASRVKGKEKADEDPPHRASKFSVVAGSYERLLYGLEGTVTPTETGYDFNLEPMFMFPAHVSCIKAVAASPGGKWLATGSADEIVKVWDLARRKEIGGLMHHQGSITYLQFPSRSHLLSASEDGTLCLFHARDWTVLRVFKGHKGRVNSVAVHPSGKVALSVGQDRTLRMWDMMRGKGSASTKLGKEGEVVRWSLKGTFFIVQCDSTLDVFSTDMVLCHTIRHASRVHSVRFCARVNGAGELMLVAAEDKKVTIYQVSEDPKEAPSIIGEMVGHSNRVKAVETLDIAVPQTTGGRTSTTIVCTVSSDGKIFVYDLACLPADGEGGLQLHPVAEYDSKGTRLTCLTVSEGREKSEGEVGQKRKRGDGEESDRGDY